MHNRKFGLVVACLAVVMSGCPGSGAPPPIPENPALKGGQSKEGTLEVPFDTVTRAVLAVVNGTDWKALSSETTMTMGVLSIEDAKGKVKAQIKYEKKGDSSTSLLVTGPAETPKETIESLYTKIAEKAK
jgi:hypothetical protein